MEILDIGTLTLIATGLGVLIAVINQVITSRESNRQQEIMLFDQIYANVLNREFRKDYEFVMYTSTFTWDKTTDLKNLKQIIEANSDFYLSFMNVWSVLSYVSDVITKGFIKFDLFDSIIQYPIINFWEKYGSLIYKLRTDLENPIMSQDLENVYNRIIQKQKNKFGPIST